MFILFIPQTSLRALRLSEIYLFFSLAQALRPQRTSCSCLLLHHIPLRALRPGESLFGFFSREGAKNAKDFNV